MRGSRTLGGLRSIRQPRCSACLPSGHRSSPRKAIALALRSLKLSPSPFSQPVTPLGVEVPFGVVQRRLIHRDVEVPHRQRGAPASVSALLANRSNLIRVHLGLTSE